MEFKTYTGSTADIKQENFDAFKARLKGPVIMPGDQQYEESRTLWNGMIDRKPAVAVRCLGTADIIACVQFARDNGLLLCIKAGGHNIGGLAAADKALMLDLSLMRGVWVDEQKRIARAQAGCLLGDIDRETQLYGLAAVLGFVSQTGAAGLTLGGGFGYLTRRWGWTADNVAGMDVVTAEGRLVRASMDENPDLFWALRGGGGNFGVVTGIDFMLHKVGPEILGGVIAWPAEEAKGVLELYRNTADSSPRELTLVCMMRPAPPAPWLPKDIHGKPIIAIAACWSGDPAEGEKALAPVRKYGKPAGDIIMKRPYVQMQSLLDATQPKGRRYYWKSEYLSEVNASLCEKVMQQAAKVRSPHSAVILFQMGGALNELRSEFSPVGNRNAKYVFNIAAAWDNAADDETNIGWARSAWNDMKVHSTGGTYINFFNGDETADRDRAALGGAIERLAKIKAQWDPQNMFCTNRNIKPAF